MLLLLVTALAASAAAPANPVGEASPVGEARPLGEARHAIAAGRLDQARIMIGAAIRDGAKGEAIERLLADLAFQSGDFHSALARYKLLLVARPNDVQAAERAGIAALRTGDGALAARLLDRATRFQSASWRAWNARGVAADRSGDWEVADRAYAKARALAPDRAEVANNLGWSLLVRGRWTEALEQLERAAALDPKSRRIADNLDLARAAVSENLPVRRSGESDSDWAARLNDAGVVARLRGEDKRAVAAFAQAIEARSHWFERAANNLAVAQASQ